MKTLLKLSVIALFLSFVTTTANATIYGSGDAKKETRNIGSFDGIRISSAFNVELTQGDHESLVIEADDNILENIITEVVGGKLKIYIKGKVRKIHTLNVYITFKDIEDLDISGAVDIEGMNKFELGEFNIEVSGASEIDLDFTATEVNLDLSGASEIKFSGHAKELNIDASGASEINCIDFEVKECEVEASGASEIKVWVTGDLRIDASGATSVRYKGSPSVDLDASGASSVRRY